MDHQVFVYGTLQTGQPYHYVMVKPEKGHATLVGKAKTVEKWPLVATTKYMVPFLLDKPGVGHHIMGELYRIDEEMLQLLDEFESCPTLYQRKCIDVTMETVVNKPDTGGNSSVDKKDNAGSVQTCYCYMLQNFKDELLGLTFYEKYDAIGNAQHAHKAEANEHMDDLREYMKTCVLKL